MCGTCLLSLLLGLPCAQPSRRRLEGVVKRLRRPLRLYRQAGMRCKLKVLLGFWQVMVAIDPLLTGY